MLELKERPKVDVSAMCEELQKLQRGRAWYIKSRNMMANRLQATVAGTIGYSSGLDEKARQKKYAEATALIKRIVAGEVTPEIRGIVLAATIAVNAYEQPKKDIEQDMKALAKQLHVADWVEHEDQRGFGLPFLAVIVGETGDLFNYANPAKVWRRLGCAPHTFDGKTLMGASWRGGKHGKLPAAEWEEFGYSPRRRSIAYLLGVALLKLNGKDSEKTLARKAENGSEPRLIDGPYKIRYEESRAVFAEKHPDYKPLRCHLHGMLLASKLLLKNLWIEWHK